MWAALGVSLSLQVPPFVLPYLASALSHKSSFTSLLFVLDGGAFSLSSLHLGETHAPRSFDIESFARRPTTTATERRSHSLL
jgi:hypothetical protein